MAVERGYRGAAPGGGDEVQPAPYGRGIRAAGGQLEPTLLRGPTVSFGRRLLTPPGVCGLPACVGHAGTVRSNCSAPSPGYPGSRMNLWGWVLAGAGGVVVLLGALDFFFSSLDNSKRAIRWLKARWTFLVSPWRIVRAIEDLARRVDALESKPSTTADRTTSKPADRQTEEFKGALWAHVVREAENAAYCQTCYLRSGRLFRMKATESSDGSVSLHCSNFGEHDMIDSALSLERREYDFARKMQIGP